MLRAKISEIFLSVQGEGLFAGKRNLFCRFYGCTFGCAGCDELNETYCEYSPKSLADEIELRLDEIKSDKTVSFTGGEPLEQAVFLKSFFEKYGKSGVKFLLETNGLMPDAVLPVLRYFDIISFDIKLPSVWKIDDTFSRHGEFVEVIGSTAVKYAKIVVSADASESEYRKYLSLLAGKEIPLILHPYGSSGCWKNIFEKGYEFLKIAESLGIDVRMMPRIHKIMGIK